MKILIAYQYLSFKGGVEEVILSQSKYLKERGHEVEILTSLYSKNEEDYTKDGIKINRIPAINFAYNKFGIPFAIPILTRKNLRKMKELIKRFDVINVHGHPYLASFIYVCLSKKLKVPVILTQHNTNISFKIPRNFNIKNLVYRLTNLIYKISDRTIGSYNLKNSDKIIAVSKETKKYIKDITKINPNKIEVIYNGVDCKKFNGQKNEALKNNLNIPQNKLILFTVRRLVFKNGIDTLLETANILKDEKRIIFLLGGEGPDRTVIEDYVKKHNLSNVILAGLISDSLLPDYYSISDIFILPSKNGEGFPMVVLESFASGVPIIATMSGGHVEIIKNGETGFIVKPDNPWEIAKKIKFLIQNKKLIREMSVNCKNLVNKEFGWDQNINKLISIFEEISNESKK